MASTTTRAVRTGPHPGAPSTVTLTEAARRTGLADSAATMESACARLEVPVLAAAAGSYVDLRAFAGASVSVALADVTVLEAGRLT